jgi:hypothetical protein
MVGLSQAFRKNKQGTCQKIDRPVHSSDDPGRPAIVRRENDPDERKGSSVQRLSWAVKSWPVETNFRPQRQALRLWQRYLAADEPGANREARSFLPFV